MLVIARPSVCAPKSATDSFSVWRLKYFPAFDSNCVWVAGIARFPPSMNQLRKISSWNEAPPLPTLRKRRNKGPKKRNTRPKSRSWRPGKWNRIDRKRTYFSLSSSRPPNLLPFPPTRSISSYHLSQLPTTFDFLWVMTTSCPRGK